MTENQLNAVLKILSIDSTDGTQVEIINLLFGMFEDAVCLKVGTNEVPRMLEWIVNECVIKRYQLIGAEHLETEGIDVLSSTYRNPAELLDEYDSFFKNYLKLYANEDNDDLSDNHKCRLL